MSKSPLDTVNNEIFSNSKENNGHYLSKHFNSSTKVDLTPSDSHPKNNDLNIKPTLDSHGFEFIEDDLNRLESFESIDSLNSESILNDGSNLIIKFENNQDISSLIPKNNSNYLASIKHTKPHSIKMLALTLATLITLGLIISLSMPNQVKDFLQNNALFNKLAPALFTPADNERQDINHNADDTQTDQGSMTVSESQKLSEQGSLINDSTENLDVSSTILNTNPEADPEVQEAINMAVGKALDTNVYKQSTNDYYEFLRASETPLLIEETPPKTLHDKFDTIEELNEEIHVDNDSGKN